LRKSSKPALIIALVLTFCASFAAQTPAPDPQDVADGMRIWRTKGDCQSCHGWAADGRKMDTQMPDGANLRTSRLSRAALITAIKCGRPGRQGKPRPFGDCCGRYLDAFASTPAPDAESLMRSRYSAFVLGRADYLLATWHASTRPDSLVLDPAQRWLGLQVKAHLPLDDAHAEVLFVARSRDASGRATRLTERSRFVRERGRWFYVDGRIG